MSGSLPSGVIARLVGRGLMLMLVAACQSAQPGTSGSGGASVGDTISDAATDTEREGELDVRLEAVGQPRPEASVRTRNPFRFGQTTRGPAAAESGVETPSTEPPPFRSPPIAQSSPRARLRMIGLIEGPETVGRIAVLTDGENVFHGREGDVVEGRYRIVAVGPVSVQIESVHDGERQTLRLATM